MDDLVRGALLRFVMMRRWRERTGRAREAAREELRRKPRQSSPDPDADAARKIADRFERQGYV